MKGIKLKIIISLITTTIVLFPVLSSSVYSNKKYLQNEVNWIRNNTYQLPKPSAVNNADFEPIRPYIANKRIVWIGESSHGVAQYNTLKSKLIKFLHQEMGFKVIAFESGLSESFSANSLKGQLSAEEMMRKSIFQVWWTKETLPLFQLLKSTDLTLAGFDFQPSGIVNPLKEILQRQGHLSKATIEKLHQLTEYSNRWYYRLLPFKFGGKTIPKDILKEFEDSKAEKLRIIAQLIHELESKPKNQVLLVVKRFLHNTVALLNGATLRTVEESIKLRDQIMADNLEWLLTVLYPHEKVVIWAHNGHIFKNYKQYPSGIRYMGSLVSKQIVDASYYIGLFMYQGKATRISDGREHPLITPPKRSLEDYMNKQKAEVGFLDFSKMQVRPENKWLSQSTIITDHESGTAKESIVPNKQLDAIFFIKNVSPPNYLNRLKRN